MEVTDDQDREHQIGQHGTLVFAVVALREVELVPVDKPPKDHALDREEDGPFDQKFDFISIVILVLNVVQEELREYMYNRYAEIDD